LNLEKSNSLNLNRETLMPVRSILYLQPKPGQRQALIDAFQRLDVFGHAMQQEGCISIEMLDPADENGALAVTALWTGPAGIQGWLENPWRAESNKELGQFVEEGPDSAYYNIVLTTPAAPGIHGEGAAS
jgi:quinol monooxygenase YgiN